jgi:hypothetical protein
MMEREGCFSPVASPPPYYSLDYFPGSINLEGFVRWLSPSVVEGDYVPDAEPNTCDRIYQLQGWKDWTTLGCPNTLLLTGVQGTASDIILIYQF